jgi:hypothetical protein
VGVDLCELSFLLDADGVDVVCHVCDFAGQEIYHLSHTLHFTRRCLYIPAHVDHPQIL